MSDITSIEWADSTFNPWMGCTKVSPACNHCYAERDTRRFGRVEWGASKPRVRTGAANWKHPVKWNSARFMECGTCGWRGECAAELIGCGSCGSISELNDARRRVFCASLADWLDNEVSIGWLADLLDLIRRTPNLDWLLLTKRIGNWPGRIAQAIGYLDEQTPAAYPLPLRRWLALWLDGDEAPENVWIGATVVNQAEVDRDVPKLLAVPARVRFLSVEPMLGPISFRWMAAWPENAPHSPLRPTGSTDHLDGLRRLDWIIAGGESGPHARPMQRDWVRSVRDQCFEAGVPFLFKQWGEWAPNWLHADDGITEQPGSVWMDRMGKKIAGRTLDGLKHNGFPVPFEDRTKGDPHGQVA